MPRKSRDDHEPITSDLGGKPDPESTAGGTGGGESQPASAPSASAGTRPAPGLDFGAPIEPATVPIPGPGGKRRGRPPGSRNAPRAPEPAQAEAAVNLADKLDLAELLLGIHSGVALMLEQPILELDKEEAERLSSAMREVAKYYSIGIDPKKLAIINLIQACGFIYGTRAIALWKGSKAAAPARKPEEIRPATAPAAPKPAPAPPAAGRPRSPADLWPQNGELTAPAF